MRSRGLLRTALLVMAVFTGSASAAQPADLFDFWVGDWTLTWTNADGSAGRGHNVIAKILDGRVIEERFEEDPAATTPLRGHSLSVLQQATGVWKQTWADNQGGYFALTASTDGDKRIFATDFIEREGKSIGQRMIFHDIKRDGFTWDWEGSTDGGRTWKRAWRIEYRSTAAK